RLVGILVDGALQERALDAETNRIWRRVALAPAPPSLRSLQRGEQLAADRGGPSAHRRHQRVRGFRLRVPPITGTPRVAPRPTGRAHPRSSAATSSSPVARSSSRNSPATDAPSVAIVFTHAPHAAQPSARRDSPLSTATRPRRRACSSVLQNGQR